MGRIQRKKPEHKKKKNRDANGLAGKTSELTSQREPRKSAASSPSSDARKNAAAGIRKLTGSNAPAPVKKGMNLFDQSVQFLREVKIELKKVTWPSRKQTMASTVVVLILVMIVSVFLGIIDLGLSNVIRMVLR